MVGNKIGISTFKPDKKGSEMLSLKNRAIADGAILEGEQCLIDSYRTLDDNNKAVMIPSYYKEGKVYGILGNDYTFARNGTAYRRNASGILESVAANVPRLDHSNGCPELLIEPQATNLLLRSEEFDNASWAKNNVNTTGTPPYINQTIAPNGTLTADKLIENTANSSHSFGYLQTFQVGVNYNISIFAKKAERNILKIQIGNPVRINFDVNFNLDNGTIQQVFSGTNAKIENYGNGWYRCSISAIGLNSDAQTNINFYTILSGNTRDYLGDETSGLFLWGAQLEVGSVATSYIPTTSATVTRLSDVATVTPPVGTTSIIRTENNIDTTTAYVSGNYQIPNGRTQKIRMV